MFNCKTIVTEKIVFHSFSRNMDIFSTINLYLLHFLFILQFKIIFYYRMDMMQEQGLTESLNKSYHQPHLAFPHLQHN